MRGCRNSTGRHVAANRRPVSRRQGGARGLDSPAVHRNGPPKRGPRHFHLLFVRQWRKYNQRCQTCRRSSGKTTGRPLLASGGPAGRRRVGPGQSMGQKQRCRPQTVEKGGPQPAPRNSARAASEHGDPLRQPRSKRQFRRKPKAGAGDSRRSGRAPSTHLPNEFGDRHTATNGTDR